MANVQFELSEKQAEAYLVLTERPDIVELVFGGGSRGGKSYLGAFWVTTEAIKYPGSAWGIFREELKALKRTTLRTFFKVLSRLGYERDVHYKYNAQDMVFQFANGSVVFCGELKYQPSDPEFDRLGSYDLTGGWIDEAQETVKDAKDALHFRLSLTEGNGWKTTPKMLYTCNPHAGWIKSDFWKPLVKEHQELKSRMFITSLYTDNPYINHEEYRQTVLSTNNKIKIERLLHGNFEYDDSPHRLFNYDSIVDMFTQEGQREDIKYISCDVARKGKDKTVIGIWEGLYIKRILTLEGKGLNEVGSVLTEIMRKEEIPRSRCIVDADGMGVGLFDYLEGIKGFNNASSAIQPKEAQDDHNKKVNYENLKTQCYMILSQMINAGKIGICEVDAKTKELIVEELDVMKQVDVDNEKFIRIIKKAKVKELIGRSPDYADMMMMRMFFEVKDPDEVNFYIGEV